ncbi:hypothetical protein ACHWQZ_G011746 [Mnemiopsis leidyi]
MKFSYEFSNLCGTVYKGGNLIFTPDSNKLLSPVGSRITIFDMKGSKTITLPFETRKNMECFTLSPCGNMLLCVDVEGRAILINVRKRVLLAHHNFKKPVQAISYSPDGAHIAVSHGKHVQLWRAPGSSKEFAPFTLVRTYPGQYDEVSTISWSVCSRYLVCGSVDMTVKVLSREPEEDFTAVTLTGHKRSVVGAWFGPGGASEVISVSADGGMFLWERSATTGKWNVGSKNFVNQAGGIHVTCAALQSALLVVGLSNGQFTLYDLPTFDQIHTLSISQKDISAVSISPSGDLLGFGCRGHGQLLVWEWKSESYVLKQQGHSYDMTCVSYSPDSLSIATGGDDGKVKVWSTETGFCYVTFNEHTAGVSDVYFRKSGNVVLSASLDGTVRAFDLYRYRNFRTMTCPTPVQFSCVACDTSGEIVAAGTTDTFQVCTWNMQTGRLLELLSGHEGPVSSLVFMEGMLVSSSWDKTTRVWDTFERKGTTDTLALSSDCTAVVASPDNSQIAVATLNSEITFYNLKLGVTVGSIEGRNDLWAGRSKEDLISAESQKRNRCFTSLSYSADGSVILAGGRSKYFCIYNVEQTVLIKRFEVSRNLSYDAMLQFLRSDNMTDQGPLDLMETEEHEHGSEIPLPGVSKGDFSKRRVAPQINVHSVQFCPTGQSWCAATTEGLLIYSLDNTLTFDPVDLDTDITPLTMRAALASESYLKALVIALRLNTSDLVVEVLEQVPEDRIHYVVGALPLHHLTSLLKFLVDQLGASRHLHFYMLWISSILTTHGPALKKTSSQIMSTLNGIVSALTAQTRTLSSLCDSNQYFMDVILTLGKVKSSHTLPSDIDVF